MKAFDTVQLAWHAPLLVVIAGAILLLLAEAFARSGGRRWLMHLGVATCAAALLAAIIVFSKLGGAGPRTLFDGMLVADRFSTFFTIVALAAALLVTLLCGDYLREHGAHYGEVYSLLLLGTAGMIVLAMAGDLVTVFLGVETMSLAAYVLTGSFRRAKRSQEAAMKYFIAGAFASGFLLYGIALVYGMVGDTNLYRIREATAAHGEPVFIIGEYFLLVAFAFKLAAVPFHMWAPDAYEGAPTPITAFMAAGVKAAGLAGIMRLFLTAFGGDTLPFGHLGWGTILGIIAAITMTVGNVAALRQENVKRMLAYSSIAHAGYLLVGVLTAGVAADGGASAARPALLYYILAYTFTTIGAFGVVAWIGAKNDERQLVDDWAGLAARHPAAAVAMTIFLLSLGGMPPTAGFFGKFYVFRAAMEAPGDQFLWLVILADGNSLISVVYYLRVVMAMYFREPAREHTPLKSATITIALLLCALLVLEMGLLPGTWLELAKASTMFGLNAAAGP